MAVSQGQDDDVMAAINITPLTDVLLVLLIIFMIAAATIQKEAIKLPITHYKDKANETDTVISVEKNGKVFVGAKQIPIATLEPYLEKIKADIPEDEEGNPFDKVIIKADEDTQYGMVAQVMDAAKSAGLNQITLATKPLEEKGKENAEQTKSSQ